jgi:nicotinamidase-related amidase
MGKFNLLIIDPQVDFHEGGNLPVEGAKADSERIIKLLEAKKDDITQIFVSLDTHTSYHIGHPGFWKYADATDNKSLLDTDIKLQLPVQLDIDEHNNIHIVNVDSTKNIRLMPFFYKETIENFVDNEIYDKNYTILLNYTKWYIKQFKGKEFKPMIWPEHCIENSFGHGIYQKLANALNLINSLIIIEYHVKGQNCLTEMYSIMTAEVQPYDYYEENKSNRNIQHFLLSIQYKDGYYKKKEHYKINDFLTETSKNTERRDCIYTNVKYSNGPDKCKELDHIYLNTAFNEDLFNSFFKDNNNDLYICGEALSHCVRYSTTDIVNKIIEEKKENEERKVHLILNCSSIIKGFEGQTFEFIKKMKESPYNDIIDFVLVNEETGDLITDKTVVNNYIHTEIETKIVNNKNTDEEVIVENNEGAIEEVIVEENNKGANEGADEGANEEDDKGANEEANEETIKEANEEDDKGANEGADEGAKGGNNKKTKKNNKLKKSKKNKSKKSKKSKKILFSPLNK